MVDGATSDKEILYLISELQVLGGSLSGFGAGNPLFSLTNDVFVGVLISIFCPVFCPLESAEIRCFPHKSAKFCAKLLRGVAGDPCMDGIGEVGKPKYIKGQKTLCWQMNAGISGSTKNPVQVCR